MSLLHSFIHSFNATSINLVEGYTDRFSIGLNTSKMHVSICPDSCNKPARAAFISMSLLKLQLGHITLTRNSCHYPVGGRLISSWEAILVALNTALSQTLKDYNCTFTNPSIEKHQNYFGQTQEHNLQN